MTAKNGSPVFWGDVNGGYHLSVHCNSPVLCAKPTREIDPALAPVKVARFQTEMPPLFVILGVQVFDRDRRGVGAGLHSLTPGPFPQSPACNPKAHWRAGDMLQSDVSAVDGH